MKRPSPLYLLAAVLAALTIIFAFATVGAAPTSSGRTGSVFDDGAGGAHAGGNYGLTFDFDGTGYSGREALTRLADLG